MIPLSTWTVESSAVSLMERLPDKVCLVGIPRGGLTFAYVLANSRRKDQSVLVRSADDWNSAQAETDRGAQRMVYLVDDIMVTGNTMNKVKDQHPEGTFAGYVVLGVKQDEHDRQYPQPLTFEKSWKPDIWISFPWESREEGGAPLSAVTRLIEYLGDDPNREGLLETPRRVLGFYDELRERRNVNFAITNFEAEKFDDLVLVRDISFSSLCEHHMLPYHGTISIGYLAHGSVVGLSKLPRAVDALSAGLTMQETLTVAIADSTAEMAQTPDVGVVSKATHTCVTIRGPRAPGTEMISSTMTGKFREDSELRAEFLGLIGG